MKRNAKIIVAVSIIIILGIFVVMKKDFNIYKEDCNLSNNPEDTCSDKIKLNYMNFTGMIVNDYDLDKEFLDNICTNLTEDAWVCDNKYLVLYE